MTSPRLTLTLTLTLTPTLTLARWDEARQFAHNANPEHSQELVRRQAAWAEETNDLGVAAETYLKAGDTRT